LYYWPSTIRAVKYRIWHETCSKRRGDDKCKQNFSW
jgi:hypothetical protein